MRRRSILFAVGIAAVAWPLVARAQPRLPRVGVLLFSHAVLPTDLSVARELARRGYVVGRNITYVIRAAESDASRMPLLARQLVAEKPDVIVAESSSAAVALFNTRRDIPVVMTIVGDPIALGLTSSISSPTHNVTGFTNSSVSLAAKQLEFLHKIVPSLHKAGNLWMPESPLAASYKTQAQQAADALGIELVSFPLTSYADIDAAFERAKQEGVTAVLVSSSPLTLRFSGRIADNCLFHGLPCMHTWPIEARNGALISYGPKGIHNYSGAADYVDRILKGAKVADLPFQEPKEIKLVVNLKAAKAIGLRIPQTVLVRADEVIE